MVIRNSIDVSGRLNEVYIILLFGLLTHRGLSKALDLYDVYDLSAVRHQNSAIKSAPRSPLSYHSDFLLQVSQHANIMRNYKVYSSAILLRNSNQKG